MRLLRPVRAPRAAEISFLLFVSLGTALLLLPRKSYFHRSGVNFCVWLRALFVTGERRAGEAVSRWSCCVAAQGCRQDGRVLHRKHFCAGSVTAKAEEVSAAFTSRGSRQLLEEEPRVTTCPGSITRNEQLCCYDLWLDGFAPTNTVMEYTQEMMSFAVAKICSQWKFIACKFWGFFNWEV